MAGQREETSEHGNTVWMYSKSSNAVRSVNFYKSFSKECPEMRKLLFSLYVWIIKVKLCCN